MDKPTAEYAALDFDGTERRANYRTVAYRIDILHLCERKDAAAILYEIIYRWQTEVRKPEVLKEIERRKKANLPALTSEEVESMMWVWMSYNDFVRESGEAVAYNTVIRMLDYLVETAQILECRENHDPRYPDYEYRIRMDVVKKKLKALPAAPAFLPKVPKKKGKGGEGSTQVGTPEKRSTQKGRRAQVSTQVGTESTQKGRATTQVGTGVYPDGGTSHTTTHTSHIEHTEEDTLARQSETATSDANASTPAPVSHMEDKHATDNSARYSASLHFRQPAHDLGVQVEEPYHPDFSADQEKSYQSDGQDGYTCNPPELSTSIPPSGKVVHAVEQPRRQRAKAEELPSEDKPKRTRAKAAPAVPEFTAEGRKVYDAWCSLFKSPPRVGPKTVECADALYPRLVPWCKELKLSCKDLLDEIQKHLYKTDTSGFYKRGITLCDIDRDFEKWQSAKTQELAELAQKAAPKSVSSLPSYHGMSDAEYYASLRGGTNARPTNAR